MQKDLFLHFLKNHFPERFNHLQIQFETYYKWLIEENQKINLISRQTDPEDIWTFHLLDSLLSVPFVDFQAKNILDFGTGGGFPGIPLAIIYATSKITLLDSRKKKIQALQSAAEVLKLRNCSFLDIRLEEVPKSLYGSFDLIVCRSVKILPEFRTPLLSLLKNEGQLILYKSKILDDVELFKNVQIFNADVAEIGERKIAVIAKKDNV